MAHEHNGESVKLPHILMGTHHARPLQCYHSILSRTRAPKLLSPNPCIYILTSTIGTLSVPEKTAVDHQQSAQKKSTLKLGVLITQM